MTARQFATRCGLVGCGIAGLALAAAILPRGIAHDRSDAEARSSERVGALPVETAYLESTDSIERLRTYTGTVNARRTSDLSFKRIGRLVAVRVDEGDEIVAGQALAVLDARSLEARRRELEAQRAAAQALLEERINGPRKETIAAARADVEELTARFELSRIEHERKQRLLATGVASPEELDQTRFTKEALRARLGGTRSRLDELVLGTRRERIEAQRAVVAQLDAALADIAIQIEDCTLAAPFDGTIGKRYVDEGTIVSPETHVLRVVEGVGLEVRIGLPVATIAHLDGAYPYEIQIDGRPYAARLHSMLPELEPTTRTRTAVFTLSSVELGAVVPGQIARIQIAEQLDVAGFWVPTTALTRGSRGLWSVYAVVKNDDRRHRTAVRRDVEVLYVEGDRTLIRGTVREGDEIVLAGTHRVVPGQSVSPLRPVDATVTSSQSEAQNQAPPTE